jgi:hypothetical protein
MSYWAESIADTCPMMCWTRTNAKSRPGVLGIQVSASVKSLLFLFIHA